MTGWRAVDTLQPQTYVARGFRGGAFGSGSILSLGLTPWQPADYITQGSGTNVVRSTPVIRLQCDGGR